MKIVNIGAHKTGTASLTNLMKQLGYKCIPGALWHPDDDYKRAVERGDYTRVIESLDTVDFFADSPYNIGEVYKALDLPDVKFILTLREPEDWFSSFLRWAKLRREVNNGSDSVLAYGGKITKENKDIIVGGYKKRIEGIYDYFGFDNICRIHVDLPDEGKIKRLEKFLGRNIDIKYPHKNRTR